MKRIIAASLAIMTIVSCKNESENKKEDWLSNGSYDERFEKVSKHLRGFDMAMAETGYRYVELFWAGRDQNFDYAKYQIEKIEVAIKNGLERRPKRAASAQ